MYGKRFWCATACGLSLLHCWMSAAASPTGEELSTWEYRQGDKTQSIEAAACRRGFDNDLGCNVLVFRRADGEEVKLPMSAFTDEDQQRFATATEASAKMRKQKEREARSKRALADKTRAMRLSVQFREDAFAKLPPGRPITAEAVVRGLSRFIKSDRFPPAAYTTAIDKAVEKLLPAVTSGNDDVIRQTMNQFTTTELAALDDFVLSTEYGKSNIKDTKTTFGDILLAGWRASLQGAADQYRPIFIEPSMRDLVVPLPGGKAFTAADFFPTRGVRMLFEEGERKKNNYSTLMPESKNKTPFAVLSQQNGKLNGPACAQFEDGGLMMAGTYADNKRTGRFLVLSEDRAIRFAAEYNAKGSKDGMLCLFRAGSPLLVQECRNDTPKTTHICGDNAQVVFSFDGLPSALPATVRDAMEFLELTEDELREAEKQIKDYVDKVEQAVRRWRVGQNGAAARARFNDLQRQQENGSLQLMQGMRNWTGN